jgi:hypothetical protein
MELDASTRRLYYTKNAQSTCVARDLAEARKTLVTP